MPSILNDNIINSLSGKTTLLPKVRCKKLSQGETFCRRGYSRGNQKFCVYEKDRLVQSFDLADKFLVPHAKRSGITLFAESTLQKVESGRDFLCGRVT